MPLPNSGVGATLPGPTGGRDPGSPRGALSRQETLFGISPEQMSGKPAPEQKPGSPVPAAPPLLAPKPAGGAQTFFGVAPPGVYPERRPEPAPAPARSAVGAAPPAAAPPPPVDAPLQNRTLVGGLVPDELARAVAAVREKAAAPAAAPPPYDGTAPAIARQPQPQPQPQPAPPPLGGAVGGGTFVGGLTPAPARPAPPRAAFEPAPAPVAPRLGPAQTAFESPAAIAGGAAPLPGPVQTAFEAPAPDGTVRSAGSPGAPDPAPAARGPAAFEPTVDAASAAPAPPIYAKTALGVAIPGIAPLHAGVPAQRPTPAPRRPGMLEETQLQPDSLTAAPLSARPQLPRGAFVLLGSGLALLIAAAAFALLWNASKPLSVAISADPSGKDRLDIVCEQCPDGTLVSLDAARAEIASNKAYLTLPEPLPLGENRVSFALQKPGAAEPELVKLTLPPVEYRIRPDTSTLVGDQPRLTLKISAIPGSTVEIARRPVALDAAGNGEIAVDLTGELIGPASEVVTFEQSIGYQITPPSEKTYQGELAFKIGVTPLLLDAPGIDTVTNLERFMLAGRTTKNAELWVAGTTIAVDGGGRFAQLMSIDSVGETRVTVRATEPGLAPRFVSFRLERVESLAAEAAQRRQKALPLADVIQRVPDHVGASVIVSGRVEEVRSDGHRHVILLSPDSGCGDRSCLVRLVYGGLRKLARGEAITAIGRLQGVVAGAAGSGGVPELDVSLLL